MTPSKLLALSLIALSTTLHAQTQSSKNDQTWSKLATGDYGQHVELRIQAKGDPIRCDLDAMTPTTLNCVQHRTLVSPLNDLLIEPESWSIPRADIREIRLSDRHGSAALGMLIGGAFGVALGSFGSSDTRGFAQGLGFIIFGYFGALIGHHHPLKGQIIYQAP